MDYIKISITVEPFDEVIVDILTAELGEIECDAFDDKPDGINAYIQQTAFVQSELDTIIANYSTEDINISYKLEKIKSENWNAVWESNFEPVIIGSRCTVRAPFHHNLPPSDYMVLISPKMSFGTGHHETTYLAVESILDCDMSGKNVLDMGCGTGILAILAAMKGAFNVLAIDNDPQASENAVENCAMNEMSHLVHVMTGDASLLSDQQFDVIVANINRNILLNDMHVYSKCLAPNGRLFLSGFYAEDCALLDQEADSLSLQKQNERHRNKWALLEYKRKD